MSVITDIAARLDALLAQRLGDAAPDADIVPGPPVSAVTEAVLALRGAATGVLDEYDLATLSETIDALAAAASLGNADVHVLTLLTLCNIDDRIGRAVGLLHDDVSRSRPSIGLTVRVLEPLVGRAAALDAAALDGTMVQRGIVEHAGAYSDADAPVANRELILHPRVLAVLISGGPLNDPEPRLASALVLEHAASIDSSHEDDEELFAGPDPDTTVYRLAALPRAGRAVGLLCVGPDLEGTLRIARDFARRERLRILRIDLQSTFALGETPESVIQLVRRESIVLHALPVWSLPAREALAEPQLARRIAHLFTAAPAPLLIHADQIWTPPAEFPLTLVHYPTAALTYRDRVDQWQSEDGRTRPADEETAQMLATSFVLPPLAVHAARADADAALRLLGGEAAEQLRRAAHRQAAARLVRFATKISPRAGWVDIVVPPSVRQQLQEIEWRIAHRLRVLEEAGFPGRRGFLALFVGASGTGKTLAAEIIAAAQGYDLFKIDLAALVSKYIGDTEKNLEQVFQDAESAHAILFFDEADAVFGKRSEVRDAHDQYANQQVNYLLQRVEAYDGIIIMATNMRQNMDEAFLRRLNLVVELPFPDEDARAEIWRRVWPAGVTVAPAVDFADLAHRFRIAGGSIRNAAIDSAFRAVSRRESVQRQNGIYIERADILLAVGREYQKLGRPITRGDFLDDYSTVMDTLFAPTAEVSNA